MKDTIRLRSSFIAQNQEQRKKSVTKKVEKIIISSFRKTS